jgi:flagellar hook-basal body complex protein FliE
MSAISSIAPVSVPNLDPRLTAGTAGGGDFRTLVESAIGQVEQSRGSAAQSVERFLSGDGEELHTALLATQKAELSLDLFLEARNKVVQAYQEIMRMQI